MRIAIYDIARKYTAVLLFTAVVFFGGFTSAHAAGTTDTMFGQVGTLISMLQGVVDSLGAQIEAAMPRVLGASTLALQDRVQATANVPVYQLTNGTYVQIATEASGALGTLTNGPVTSNGSTWWQVTWDNGNVGSSDEAHLALYVAPDTTKPDVNLTSPSGGSMLSGSVTLKATASDNVGVKYVQFKVDGTNVGTADASAPYTATWNTTLMTDGSHNVNAVARDAAGNVRWSSTAKVTVDNTKPSVTLTSPTDGTSVSGTITLKATASDNIGVKYVRFWIDGTGYSTQDHYAPYTRNLDTKTVLNGEHTIKAIAMDAAGNFRWTGATTVTVNNTAPTATFVTPANGATLSGKVTLQATPSIPAKWLDFSVNGKRFYAGDYTAPYTHVWDTTKVADGTYHLRAVYEKGPATNIVITSAPITVTVKNNVVSTTTPTVVFNTPKNGDVLKGKVTLQATPSVPAKWVDFSINGNRFHIGDYTAPYAYVLDTTKWKDGTYQLRALFEIGPATNKVVTSAPLTVTFANHTVVSNKVPNGYAGGVWGGAAHGWVYDPDSPNTPIDIHIYADGQSGVGTDLGTFTANLNLHSILPGTITYNHWYSVPVPAAYQDGTQHTFYVYGVDAQTGTETLLKNNPTTFTLAPITPSTKFSVNDRVETTAALNVRQDSNGSSAKITTELKGSVGTVIGGPVVKPNYTWWQVKWDNGYKGWSVERYLMLHVDTTDTTKPSITLASPVANATVSGPVTLSADASDNVGVKYVRFWIDNKAFGTQDTAAPYTTTWNTTLVEDGSHTINAVARDAAGNTQWAGAINVTVHNTTGDTEKPVITLTSPKSGDTITGTITLSADATDNVGVASVQFSVDGKNVGTPDTTAPYTYLWNSKIIGDGAHTINAVAKDAAGNTQWAGAITVTTKNTVPPALPLVSFKASPSTITAGGSATLSWSSLNATACAGTGFATGGVASGTKSVTPTATKTYSIKCTGIGGSTSTSTTVTVTSAPIPPTVSLTASPTSITAGATTTLTWFSTNATVCTGTGFATGKAVSGTKVMSPAATKTYSIMCTGLGGSTSTSTTVTVTSKPVSEFSTSTLATNFVADPKTDLLPASFFGVHWVNTGFTAGADRNMALSRIRELNLGAVRYSLPWAQLFATDAGCTVNIIKSTTTAKWQALIDKLPSRVELHAILTRPPTECRDLYKSDPAAFRAMWQDYVRQIVNTFGSRVHVWEIWNEPNGGGFGMTDPSGKLWTASEFFRDAVLPAATEIRKIEPQATIVLTSVASNGVMGHECGTSYTSTPCPPPAATGAEHADAPWFMYQNYLPDLIAAINQYKTAHPHATDPYSLFDVIATHPYYWTIFDQATNTKYPNGQTYVPPSTMTYGGTGSSINTIGSLIPNTEKPIPIWWTELNEKLALHLDNNESGQAYRLGKILDQTLVDHKRSNFPLDLFEWFNLRDRACADFGSYCTVNELASSVSSMPAITPGHACPFGDRNCITESTNSNGKPIYKHPDYSGLLGFTEGNAINTVPRKVFYVMKDFIADHTNLDSIIDDFMGKRILGTTFDHSFWNADCTSLTNCGPLFADNAAAPEVLSMQAPAKTNGPWQKAALTSAHTIAISDKNSVTLDYDFSVDPSAAGDHHYSVVALGKNQGTAASFGRFYLLFDRTDNTHMQVQVLETTKTGSSVALLPWTDVAANCSAPNFSGMNHAHFVLNNDGTWALNIKDSAGNFCVHRSDTANGAHKQNLSFTNYGPMAISLMGISEQGGGTYQYDNVDLEGQKSRPTYRITPDNSKPVVTHTPTASLSASPNPINAGDSTTLTWSSTNATVCTGVGFATGKLTHGTKTVTPTATKTYAVSCSGTSGTASDTAMVSVHAPTVATFAIGDRVQTTDRLVVRTDAGSSYSKVITEIPGSVGTVTDGPIVKPNYTWWKVRWTNGYEGWSVENYLKAYVDVTDTEKPVVTLTSLSYGDLVTGTITLKANASDNVGVKNVQFKVDNVNVGTADASAQYTTTWDTTHATNGSHDVRVVARDTAGNVTWSTVTTVTVNNSTASKDISFVTDPTYQKGITVWSSADATGAFTKTDRLYPFGGSSAITPEWQMGQWGSQYPMDSNTPKTVLANGGIEYKTPGKRVVFGPGNHLTIGVNAIDRGKLYQPNSTQLLSTQKSFFGVGSVVPSNTKVPLTQLKAYNYQMSFKLTKAEYVDGGSAGDTSVAAHTLTAFRLTNMNPNSPGKGQFVYFVIELYDNRYRTTSLHLQKDRGTGALLYELPSSTFYGTQSAWDMKWITIDKDLLPLFKNAITTGVQQKYLTSSDLSDYVATFSPPHWEVTAPMNVEMQYKDFNVTEVLK